MFITKTSKGLIHNCLWLIKLCAYSHVTIKQTVAVIEVQSILILKAIEST